MKYKINRNYIILFLLGIIILFARSAYNFIIPSMYTEDGVWISDIINNGFFHTLVNAKGSYFVFGNIILLEVSNFLNFIFNGKNLNYLPVFVSLVQYIFMVLCSLIAVKCMEKELNKYLKFVLYLLILLVPLGFSGFEILGKISNTGYLFYFLASCLLYYRLFRKEELSKYKNLVIDFILLICCGTNPGCYVLVGVSFIIDILMQYKFNKRNSFIETIEVYLSKLYNQLWIILGVLCSFMLFYNLVKFDLSSNGVIGNVNYSNTIEFFARALLFYFVYPIYTFLNDKLVLILFLVCFIVIVMAYKKGKGLEKIKLSFLLFSAVFYSLMTFFSRTTLTSHLNNYTTSWVDRYYYGINITTLLPIMYIISLFLKKQRFQKNIGYISLIILILCPLLSISYLFQYDDAQTTVVHKIKFSDRIKNIELNDSISNYIVPIDFEGWTMNLPYDYILASQLNQRNPESLTTSNLTDENWENGVIRSGNILLFDSKWLNALNKCNVLKSEDKVVNIVEIRDAGQWIHVLCDTDDLKAFEYPNVIEFYKTGEE